LQSNYKDRAEVNTMLVYYTVIPFKGSLIKAAVAKVPKKVKVQRKDGTSYWSTRWVAPDTKLKSESYVQGLIQIEYASIMSGQPLRTLLPFRGTWKTKMEGMPKSTLDAHKQEDGVFKPERAALHQKIVNEILNKVPPVPEGQQPVAVFMMGGPASGKSSMVRALGVDKSQFVIADADAVKERIPEYRVGVKNNYKGSAAMVHEESSMLVKRARAKAIEQRKNLIIDGTGKDPGSYLKSLDKLEEQGYKVKLYMADIDAKVAIGRAKKRAERTGRYVPLNVLSGAFPTIPNSFATVAEKVDEYAVFNTNVPFGQPPKMIVQKTDSGDVTIGDSAMYNNLNKRMKRKVGK